MRKLHPMIAALAAVTIAFAACAQEGAEEGTAEEDAAAEAVDNEAAIRAMADTFEERWAAHDWDGVLELYTADYQEVTSEGGVMGYAEMEASMRDSTNQPPEGARIDIGFDTLEVSEAGDIAFGSGTTSFTATLPDGTQIDQQDHWVAGFQNEDGQWKVDRLAIVAPPGDGGPMGAGAMDDGSMDDGGMDDEGADDSM